MYDVSVVVPVYNAASFIERCLESIIKQTVSNLELICVNDGSNDDSLSILMEFKKKHELNPNRKIVIINQENGGPSSARNAGINHASGRYLAFVDSDDYVEPEMYQSLITIAEQNQIDVVICGIKNVYSDSKVIESNAAISKDKVIDRNEILSEICPTLMREGIFGGPCNRVYRTDFICNNQIRMPNNIGYGEDAVFQMQVFDKLERTWFDSRSYYHYIHRGNSQTTPKPAMFCSTFEPLFKIRCEYGEKWGVSSKDICNHFVYCTIMDMVNTLSSSYKGKCNYLKKLFRNSCFRYAVHHADFAKDDYTKKIYFVYRLLKLFIRKEMAI